MLMKVHEMQLLYVLCSLKPILETLMTTEMTTYFKEDLGKGYKLFFHAQLSMKFILLINVKITKSVEL